VTKLDEDRETTREAEGSTPAASTIVTTGYAPESDVVPARCPPAPKWIYFIQCHDELGAVKIGYARDPETRLHNLQMGCPYLLTIIAKCVVADAPMVERALHRRFAGSALRGEWFVCTPEIIETAERVSRYQIEAFSAYLAETKMPSIPVEITGDINVCPIDPTLSDAAAALLKQLRAKKRADYNARARRAAAMTSQQPKPSRVGEFTWRGKLRKPR
jgi:hypothetical protein